ncbi:terminase large subunit domain-containing protein [Erythrobacter sp. NE805]|uniref:terminase large subunit domain-containing protein n=1 Tax=Erythrobacter sp. NE805 TaxID=3389875 RepID=UPI00396B33D9
MTDPFDWAREQDPDTKARFGNALADKLDQGEKNGLDFVWEFTARNEQLPPPGDWRIWMIMAGRGFGKTRSGAEWVRMIADANPGARIALVSSSLAEARAVMVEGESGLLAICRPDHKPVFEPSLHRVRFKSGAQAQLFSAAEPETLRGPQHSHACRAGAEGVLCQRGAFAARRAARARGQGLAARAPGEPGGGRLLPRDRTRDRRLGQPRG